jgi:hypothetical protein
MVLADLAEGSARRKELQQATKLVRTRMNVSQSRRRLRQASCNQGKDDQGTFNRRLGGLSRGGARGSGGAARGRTQGQSSPAQGTDAGAGRGSGPAEDGFEAGRGS